MLPLMLGQNPGTFQHHLIVLQRKPATLNVFNRREPVNDQPENSWGTFDPEDQFAGTSLKKRAEKRTVQQTGERAWLVHGDAKMGDAYPNYQVELKAGERKYNCSCYGHGRGEYRRRRMCSHVLAVILYRKKKVDESEVPNHPYRPETWDTEPVDVDADRVKGEDPEKDAERRGEARRGGAVGSVSEVEATIEIEPSGRFKSSTANTYPDDPIPMDDDALGSPPMPDKFTEFRDNQWDAIVEIMEHLEAGKKAVMLSAPTGSGKTILGETVRRLTAGTSVYCCTTKSLQDQIQREFSYAKTIKSRTN